MAHSSDLASSASESEEPGEDEETDNDDNEDEETDNGDDEDEDSLASGSCDTTAPPVVTPSAPTPACPSAAAPATKRDEGGTDAGPCATSNGMFFVSVKYPALQLLAHIERPFPPFHIA